MPLASASSTARLEGALTAASTGMPARAAFWTSSKEARPETCSTVPGQRQQPFAQRPAHHFVHGVVPAHVLAQAQQLAPPSVPIRKSPAAWTPPVASKTACASRSRSGRDGQRLHGDGQRVCRGAEVRRLADGLDGIRAADAAGARGEDVPPRVREDDVGPQLGLHHVEGLHAVLVLAGAKPQGDELLGGPDDALGDEESGHEVKVVCRESAWSRKRKGAQPDFQRFLHRQDVFPVPDGEFEGLG